MKAIRIDPRIIKPLQIDVLGNWNTEGETKYPDAKLVQFTMNNYSQERRKRTRVLDLGCGSGVNMAFLAREGFRVTGIDSSEVGIANTLERLSDEQLPFDKLHCTTMGRMNFNSDSFDLVVGVNVFDWAGYDESKKAVWQIYDILKIGGKGIFSFASDKDSRTELLKDTNFQGFTDLEVKEIFSFFPWKQCCYDRHITTFKNGASQQNNFLITVEK